MVASTALACPLPQGTPAGRRIDHEPLQLTWRAAPEPIPAGRAFVIEVALCPAGARLVRVDATMPEHRHGMNYRPSLKPLGAGRWRVEGLMWHMAGRWEWQFEVELAGAREVLRQSVQVR